MVCFRPLADAQAFETAYQDFLVAVERMPAYQRKQVVHVVASPLGQPPYARVLELYYADRDTLEDAMRTPQGQAAGALLARFGAGGVDILFGEVYEETV